eukprot:TRINITY_DN5833_c0_g1_i2.p1 TRINITY_DN5833_c0_g1~~TRINITY_DN5833_c0_g1_i2.p1  ORF type:complete len:234 (-),score=45.34 TRINITY_DN5833_c0_g1_i2:264-965(-)
MSVQVEKSILINSGEIPQPKNDSSDSDTERDTNTTRERSNSVPTAPQDKILVKGQGAPSRSSHTKSSTSRQSSSSKETDRRNSAGNIPSRDGIGPSPETSNAGLSSLSASAIRLRMSKLRMSKKLSPKSSNKPAAAEPDKRDAAEAESESPKKKRSSTDSEKRKKGSKVKSPSPSPGRIDPVEGTSPPSTSAKDLLLARVQTRTRARSYSTDEGIERVRVTVLAQRATDKTDT